MTQTLHGHHIDDSTTFDDDPTMRVAHCGGRRSCRQCLDEMNIWDSKSKQCTFCNGDRKTLVASVCPNCGRDWVDITT